MVFERYVESGGFSIHESIDQGTNTMLVEVKGKEHWVVPRMNAKKGMFPSVKMINGRCDVSMRFLDDIHRDYVMDREYSQGDIVAIKSVAGSGKTTTLVNLAKKYEDKKVLYLAFNKNLVTDIKNKKIPNLYAKTFDALVRELFIDNNGYEPQLVDLKAQTIAQVVPWFQGKPYTVKNFYVKKYLEFCRQVKHTNINSFMPKKMLKQMWDSGIMTFDSMRKMTQIQHWCRDVIDEKYDMILIDEAQDFDDLMLDILIKDTTLPKIFVGDTHQAIYKWRGCINAFDKLPPQTMHIEFYSTFRIGSPACEGIASMFPNINMISRSDNHTELTADIPEEYDYLFRSWRELFKCARKTSDIWISSFAKQVEFMKKLHKKLQFSKLSQEEKDGFSDDLPMFLLSLSSQELGAMIAEIESNLVREKDAKVKMYTIHSYKGMENDNVRVFCSKSFNDQRDAQGNITKKRTEETINLYYVAMTRGRKNIIMAKDGED